MEEKREERRWQRWGGQAPLIPQELSTLALETTAGARPRRDGTTTDCPYSAESCLVEGEDLLLLYSYDCLPGPGLAEMGSIR